jgi:3-oxoacyl-[acyl-carrier protein] reductase
VDRLTAKVALVTGAGSGFGAGIAQRFVAEGALVGVLDIEADAAQRVARDLGDSALPLVADTTQIEQVRAALSELETWSSSVDILVNNAGVGLPPTPLEEVDASDFERVLDVNVRAIYVTSKIVVPAMKQRNQGCILNIASTAGVSPRPNLTWYNASKGWVITATKSMAIELAPHNIRVNALNPVAGDTPLLATFMGEDTPEMREKFLATIPLGRFSTPEDLGYAATYLCSEEASLVTGVTMEVDGGRCI